MTGGGGGPVTAEGNCWCMLIPVAVLVGVLVDMAGARLVEEEMLVEPSFDTR